MSRRVLAVTLIAPLVTGIAVAEAFAREPGIPRGAKTFQRLDKDKDGKIHLAPVTPDPYADVPMPVVTGHCHNKNVGHPQQTVTVSAHVSNSQTAASGLQTMRFCNGLQLKGRVHFDPGVYIIENGDLSINANAHITGQDVVFFFTDGAESKLNGSALIQIEAPDSGLFSGLLFFGDRNEQVDHQVNGSSGTYFQGAVYFPSSNITYNGGAGAATGCTQIIGDTIDFIGNSDLELDCTGVGIKDIEVGGSVMVVE